MKQYRTFAMMSAVISLSLLASAEDRHPLFTTDDHQVIEEADGSFFIDERDLKNTWGLTYSTPTEIKLKIGQRDLPLRGQTSFLFYVTPELIKRGMIKVESLNLAVFGVNQPLITGKKTRGPELGVLGLGLMGPKRSQIYLKYDANNQTISGEVPVNLNFPQVDELTPQDKRNEDFYVSPAINASYEVHLKIEKPIESLIKDDKTQTILNGEIQLKFRGALLGDTKLQAIEGTLAINRKPLDIFPLLRFEIARRLCLQPVSIRSSATDNQPTGAGLSFGIPGANTQWKKADVVFQVRSWKTITNSTLKIADNSTEESQIRGSVQDDDCIEVFFVENFNPVDTHGGGATWSSGTASSQIISSDGNATGGIDFTHLAHELGHVLALGHPSGSPGLVSGNTGTLMCPSGWHRDNPTVNSLGNKDNANNPLLTFAIKARTAGPDCTNNADCGPCPF